MICGFKPSTLNPSPANSCLGLPVLIQRGTVVRNSQCGRGLGFRACMNMILFVFLYQCCYDHHYTRAISTSTDDTTLFSPLSCK